MSISKKAKVAFAAALSRDEERLLRVRMIGYGVCPDCGEQLDKQYSGKDTFWNTVFFSRKEDWCDWTRSCPNHGIVDRGWFA
jgi:hypothetical protein